MSGRIAVIGLGPGDARYVTPQAEAALHDAQALYGYGRYLDRVPVRAGQARHASDNREELDRATAALEHAAEGADVAIVSGGDPGVFAMAAAVFEAVEEKPEWRALDISVLPGVTAMQAAAARLGAPLGHDFCAISLSDNLKPWSIVERRLKAAAYVGDTPPDMAAAVLAGVRAVGVATGSFTGEDLADAGAEVVLDSLEGFPAWYRP